MISRFLPYAFAFALMGGFAGAAFADDESLQEARDAFDWQAWSEKGNNPDALFEGREEELANALGLIVKTFQTPPWPYAHQMNDALVRQWLTSLQFAKDNGMIEQYVAHEVKTVSHILKRKAKEIAETGDLDIAIESLIRTSCFVQLVIDGHEREPGKLTYVSPFKRVLDATAGLTGQHDLSEKEIHKTFTVPRIEQYAEILGVDLQVSEWNDDGIITITVAPIS